MKSEVAYVHSAQNSSASISVAPCAHLGFAFLLKNANKVELGCEWHLMVKLDRTPANKCVPTRTGTV